MDYYFEITDTYGGEANYCWVRHYKIMAKSLHAALCVLARNTGYNFRFDGARYNAVKACVCAFLLDDDESINQYNFETI